MIRFNSFTLPNGLRCIHQQDDSTCHTAINIVYGVGSRNENPNRTGLAHLMEHLMFSGSANIDAYDEELERAGGTNNAWTSPDFTCFYDILPACNIETAFRAESDRMFALSLSQKSLEVQRSVVMEEYKQVCLNRPYGDIGHLLRRLIYTTHPYRFPTIGKELSHLQNISLDDVKQFYSTHYAPNNAVMSIVGPISLKRAQELSYKWFATIPRREIATPSYAVEPEITHERTIEVSTDKVPNTRIIIALPMCGRRHPDYAASDIITDILASGNSSPFHRNLLVPTDLFVSVDASVSGSDDPGYLMLSATLRHNSDNSIQEAQTLMWEEAIKLTWHIEESDLTRAVNRMESNLEFSRANYFSRTQELSLSTMQQIDCNDIVPSYRRLTPAKVERVASEIFNPDRRCTLIYRAK